ncbi:hypothetical protein ASPBRDRAFT_38162 [Aspergillus brasiliensis CBS 101740]|uniref:Uncharacterized protein n=1 Tax=Aspergillus brasiliensis (strain CBS 101740 / IMI 381727 / IBT 21946) TaxID=767769 RepID=A0A1L9UVY8_ASPBC|nr:hypothetical protein ASPBRDRAFT_38162 [Aspergillus brasiliensis CBS 101740]
MTRLVVDGVTVRYRLIDHFTCWNGFTYLLLGQIYGLVKDLEITSTERQVFLS